MTLIVQFIPFVGAMEGRVLSDDSLFIELPSVALFVVDESKRCAWLSTVRKIVSSLKS